jgi:hypothetical protein
MRLWQHSNALMRISVRRGQTELHLSRSPKPLDKCSPILRAACWKSRLDRLVQGETLRDENVEQIWYALWLIKALIAIGSLCLFGAVALICNRLLRRIPWNRVNQRSVRHAMVHSFGTLQPPRNLEASESKAVDPRATIFDRYGEPVRGSTLPKSEENSVEVDELSG